jgi:epoxyqueuosine reductase
LSDLVTERAKELGFSAAAVVSAEPSKRLDNYLHWIESQHHGEMAYLARPDRIARRQDLNVILPGVQSIVCVAAEYSSAGPPEAELADPLRGRISNYAWPVDYHETMLPKLEQFAAWLSAEVDAECRSRAYVDTGAILERDHAELAGLGFRGKNTMLIAPKRGSWFFLGEILTTAQLPPTVPAKLPSCGTCSRCLSACPTDAFPTPYTLDARRCISYLTIELKNSIPIELRGSMQNWVYGCDVCQTVCPFNRFATTAATIAIDDAAPRLTTWLTMSRSQFAARFAETPLARTGRDRIVRNACIAAGNSGSASLIPLLADLLSHDDSPLVRGHAAWGLGKLEAFNTLALARRRESHEDVRREIAIAIGRR